MITATETREAAAAPPRTTANHPKRCDQSANSNDCLQAVISVCEQTEPLVSYYSGATAPKPAGAATLTAFMEAVTSNENKRAVERLRERLASNDEDGYAKAKKLLEAVSLSGETTTGGRAKSHEQDRFVHSGYMQIDFDGKDNIGWTVTEMRDILQADPRVVAAFVSPSGEGVKGVARIQPNVATHLASFIAVREFFAKKNLTVDESCKDPGRLCFVSWDPDGWIDLERSEIFEPAENIGDKDDDKNESLNPLTSTEDRLVIRSEAFPEPPHNNIHSWLMTAAWWCRLQGSMTEAEAITKLESYSGSLRRSYQENEVRDAVKKVYAEKLESSIKWEIPEDVIPLPGGSITYTKAAEIIFNAFASKNTLFIREDVVHEIKRGKIDTLQPVEPERFCSIVEKVGKRIARREVDNDKKVTWRSARFPQNAAKIILATDEAKTVLPNIYQLTNCPIITPDGSILTKGYHTFNGGTYISTGEFVPDVSLERAVQALVDLLGDFAFTTPADKSRAVASLISPAFKMGGHITDDFPLDFAEADKSQSGKTYRQMLVTRLYNEAPAAIVQPKGGVGSLDETISKVLIQGRPFVVFDNIRGKVDSQIMESAIRGVGKVNCRIPRVASVEVNSKPFLWQLSTNGAELTRDLANRSIITRIRKQPEDYRWHDYLEGDLLSHVVSRQAIYLGAIFAVVRAWLDADSPRTKECRHDFRDWVQVMDWIVQNLFKMPPLLEGHREEQARTANPRLQWLRDVAFATADSQMTERELSASELCTIAEDAGIELPGNPHSKEEPHQRAGKILGLLYREIGGEKLIVDGFSVIRTESVSYEHGERKNRFYTFLSSPCHPVTL